MMIFLLPLFVVLSDRAEAIIYPIASSLNLHAEANAGAGLVAQDNGMSQTTALNPLSAAVLAQAFNGSLQATTESSATATWTSAAAGQFTIDTRFITDDLSSIYSSRVATGSPGWAYSFSSDQSAVLTLNYTISYTGNFAYSTLLFLNESASSSLVRQVDFSVPPTTGTLSFAINPYVNYTLQLFDDSNLNQDLPAMSTDMTGTFSFQIASVPEPENGLLLGGVAVVACYLRRCHQRT
jgi:hypothetical protein